MLGLDHVEVTQVFQSTLSVRRATHQLCQLSKTIEVFQSTLSVRRATRVNVPVNIGGTISIHALRKESDRSPAKSRRRCSISIHALRKESDAILTSQLSAAIFQSTLSVRRATRARAAHTTKPCYFNPRSP